MSEARVMWMRGGTSKGAYFLADDLPHDRDRFLLRIMGSPDDRQIDGKGGADPLTSKVAIVKKSMREGVDVDFLFLQVFVDQPIVSDAQNCGNILAGVGPFAIERRLVATNDGETKVSIFMENTGQLAVARISTPKKCVNYEGTSHIDGVPGTSAGIPITSQDTEGSSCGALLPSGNSLDQICGIRVTMIDNGMPVVLLDAGDFGLSGNETPDVLEQDHELRKRLDEIRLACGPVMNLGDVSEKSVPKMTLVSAVNEATISTRSFIPHRCHKAIGVLGAVSVATACLIPGSIAYDMANRGAGSRRKLSIKHPTGEMTVIANLEGERIVETAILRTARKLMDGIVFGA